MEKRKRKRLEDLNEKLNMNLFQGGGQYLQGVQIGMWRIVGMNVKQYLKDPIMREQNKKDGILMYVKIHQDKQHYVDKDIIIQKVQKMVPGLIYQKIFGILNKV
ncbi:unnamed protein product [Paramecium sonneborni]|uniref:Uncharacterized protein n=1 Tax=Paramecium sonneborni TaxID=65129 RepID=A0A8S1RM95_9CILI|nr:unnamed protein product [Paramecium sonneborni]